MVVHVGKAAFFSLGGPAPLYRDALRYWELGSQAASGDWLLLERPGATRTPIYPWFLALHRIVFGELGVSAAAATQQLAAAGAGVLAAWICWRATGSLLGVVLALLLSLASVSRALISHYLWSDNLLALLLTLTLVVFVEWWRRVRDDTPGRRAPALAFVLGLGLGLCALTRPVAQYLVVPVVGAVLFCIRDAGSRRGAPTRWGPAAAHAGLLLLGFSLTLAPWLLRNQALFGEPFLVKFTGRTTWLSCFHPRAANLPFPEGPALARVLEIADQRGGDRRELWDVYAALTRAGHSELEADDLMAAATAETIRSLPLEFTTATARQMVGFWTYAWPVPRWRRNDPLIELEGTFLDQRPWRLEAALPYYAGLLDRAGGPRTRVFGAAALATFAGLGLLLARRELRALAFALGAPLLYFPVVTAIASYPLYRFRSILEPTMIAVVSIAVGCLAAGRRGESSARVEP